MAYDLEEEREGKGGAGRDVREDGEGGVADEAARDAVDG